MSLQNNPAEYYLYPGVFTNRKIVKKKLARKKFFPYASSCQRDVAQLG